MPDIQLDHTVLNSCQLLTLEEYRADGQRSQSSVLGQHVRASIWNDLSKNLTSESFETLLNRTT